MAESNGTQVHFMKTAIAMSGKYSCEVSADSPSFRTSVVYAEMEVIDPPKGRPVLSGLKAKYSLGDIIHANCSSPGSRPAVNLTWVLNGKSAPRKHVKHYREVTTTDLITSISTIKLHAREAHFPNGQLKLKCTASLHNLYWQTTEKSAELVRRTSTYGSSATSRNTNRIPNNNDIYETKPATNIITNDILVIPPSDFRSSEQPYSVYDNNGIYE
ncbi:hypothetical protein O3M35_007943 [Rhynocoris fuscipes]|uniref:Ig-like domain-containing protein n=1 Tax=Rhynocoris fuscipes TaxID=488301 RepID=A0AAW1DBB9_9HEMI